MVTELGDNAWMGSAENVAVKGQAELEVALAEIEEAAAKAS